MDQKKILIIAGARPNFMKIAPLIRAVEKRSDLQYRLIHTGQHYDSNMSDAFFEELGIPHPHYNLEVGSSTHAFQTARIMMNFEPICLEEKPHAVVVVGDTNSAAACSLVAKKLNFKLAHVEAGLRSRDWSSPDEINRMVTDSISDLLFVTEEEGVQNLLKEGKERSHVHFVGNVMIDNLRHQLAALGEASLERSEEIKKSLPERYAVLTMHHPSNVDHEEKIRAFLETFKELSISIPLLFPCHPRTTKKIKQFQLTSLLTPWEGSKKYDQGVIVVEPLGYKNFLNLWKDAAFVLTDSGGLQEETTALQVPCVTFRESTERPITVMKGSNELAGTNCLEVARLSRKAIEGEWKKGEVPPKWDGKASERIAEILGREC